MVSGFLAYAENVLLFDRESYIPYFHGDKSTIEALFAYARGMRKDDPLSYPTAVTGNSFSFSATRLTNNKLYSDDHIDKERNVNNESYGSSDDIHKKKEKLRGEKFERWTKSLVKNTITAELPSSKWVSKYHHS